MLKSVKLFGIGRNSGVIFFQPSGSPFECSNLKILVAPSLPTSNKILMHGIRIFIFPDFAKLALVKFGKIKIPKSYAFCGIVFAGEVFLGMNGINPKCHTLESGK